MSENETRKKKGKNKTLILIQIFHYKLVEEIKGSTNLEMSLKDHITYRERQSTTCKLSSSEKMENISVFDHSAVVKLTMMSWAFENVWTQTDSKGE